ncbi:perlucin-like [Pomacea canaliculata]|uniref:perlucin-like n=1 Tax=Pomacea canaliculata TaxID=400727 RepID=UPI000D739C56|nr:perlucin-like [Pomacea canaliculata]
MLNEDNVAGQADGKGSPALGGSTDVETDCPSRDGYVWLRAYRTCIKFYQTPMIFMYAYRTCTSVGTRLAVLNTTAKYKAVTTYLTANGISVMRISIGGARDGAINGSRTTWSSALHPLYWVNGMKMAFSGPDTFWSSGNPDNFYGIEGCLELYWNFWNDGQCDLLKPFICEKVLN